MIKWMTATTVGVVCVWVGGILPAAEVGAATGPPAGSQVLDIASQAVVVLVDDGQAETPARTDAVKTEPPAESIARPRPDAGQPPRESKGPQGKDTAEDQGSDVLQWRLEGPLTLYFDQEALPRLLGSEVLRADYYLGVALQPASETLRSHLKLSDGIGLVVNHVAENSPAERAGLKQHDVLTQVDQNPIKRQEDLVEALQKAGQEDREVTLDLIRTGEPHSLKVKPAKRPEGDVLFRVQPEAVPLPAVPGFVPPGPDSQGRLRLWSLPSEAPPDWVRQHDQRHDDLKQQIEQLRQEVEALRRAIEKPAAPQ